MQSMDKVQYNIEKIREMFPNAVTEVKRGEKTELAVDFDVLKQELADTLIDERELRYQFTWPDKQKSILLANTPVKATLRPDKEKSVDFDNTQNLYIEGDNLDVLKLLRETYLGKIKMIYIDPPYNTGNDFVYEDDFALEGEEYKYGSGQYDEAGNRLFQNTESNGRFHTDWLNMIYPRLKVAKDLLSDDGVIFISIGQDEIDNIIKLCDEIYGRFNQLGIISRQMKSGGGSQGKYFAHNIDYVVIYSKCFGVANFFRGEMSDDLVNKVYNCVESFGPRAGEHYRTMGLYQSSLGVRPSLRYYIKCPDGQLVIPPGETFPHEAIEGKTITPIATDGVWRWSYELYRTELEKGNIEFKKTDKGVLIDENRNPSHWNIYTKIWLKDRQDEGTIPNDLLTRFENRHSAKELSALSIPFEFAKPVGLIKYLIKIMHQKNDITVLDFFSGSATTAHAVMQLNAEDGGNRKFIMVQLPEPCDKKSEAYKAGYKTICDIGEERIRRAGKKILDDTGRRDIYIKAIANVVKVKSVETSLYLFATETEEKYVEDENSLEVQEEYVHDHIVQIINEGTPLGEDTKLYDKYEDTIDKTVDRLTQLLCGLTYGVDVGFRVLRLDSSNMREVYYHPEQYTQTLLDGLTDNIKEDRTPLDLLFQVMLDLGVKPSAKIEEKDIAGKRVFVVNENELIACFDNEITDEVVKAIAKCKPLYAAFRDSSLASDSVAANFEQIFATYSPNTKKEVL